MSKVREEALVRIPVSLRVIAGAIGALAYIWSVVLVIQGRVGLSLILGGVGTLCLCVTFAPMRESAY
jgi:hypothetical protein